MSNKLQNLLEFDRWLSNDNFKLVKVTKSCPDFVEYHDHDGIRKINSKEFVSNFKPVDLDTTLHNNIPNSYMGDNPIWF